MHECTRFIFHVKSPRKMFWSKMKSLSWVLDDKWNASDGGFVDLMEVQWRKALNLMRCTLSWSGKMVKWMESEVLETWKCFSLENFGLRKKTSLKMGLDPLSSKKMCLCSPTQAPLSLSKGKRFKWGSRGQNFGFIYMHGRWKVAQSSLKYWLETLKLIIGTFTLSPINDQI